LCALAGKIDKASHDRVALGWVTTVLNGEVLWQGIAPIARAGLSRILKVPLPCEMPNEVLHFRSARVGVGLPGRTTH
jgi:hypothetical protein